MPTELAQQFDELWQSGSGPPDVFAFLEQQDGSDASQKIGILLTDQQHRWKTGSPLKVEDYLAKLPDLGSDPEIILELAVGEFQARQNSDTAPNIDEFTSRFSEIGDQLRSKLSELAESDKTEDKLKLPTTETYISDTTVGDQQLGRYRLVRILGQGAFGRVYLAFDEELHRQVAIKVPTEERFQKPEDAEHYLEEARKVASLDHPNIVPVHDVGRTEDGSVYVVSKFIEGGTLSHRIKRGRPSHDEVVRLIATVATALHHAHEHRLIHRDVKLNNILIDEKSNTPYIADFGLAISEEDYLRDSKIAGTPAYMSPEQARGEGHRLDGRSDIFSLGVVLYELLTGKPPFRGSTTNEVFHQIISVDPRSPRDLDDSIPTELDRICLKALSKQASDRYATAGELADDLIHWNDQPQGETKELTIVPKGLRSFDAEDADFFLDLLPGPRNRNGLPESIQFWKTRIEETDPDKTFSVGLIYGPSGCGKSSLVKAGLLPRLSDDVAVVYVEATPNDTETRILRGFRKQLPELADDLGLVEAFTALRRGEGRKVFVVLDQFEQWLHVHRGEQETELVSALRQCDGSKLQAVVMVRDDFSMAASRFMDSLDIRIVQGENFGTVDLFDVDHARKVLIKFGQAFGKLPDQTANLTDDEKSFVRTVASGLSQDCKVVSVRLALFAEMVKGKPWVPATLEEVGGTEGIGVNFLEETFSSRTANPKHRLHQQPAREVLKALLPEVGSDIKGHMRSHAELLEASGYQNRLGDFNDLLRILDGELRLITPTDPEGFQTESGSDPDSKFYQLTHDYLVPSLREWLTRKQQETRKGRAELKLAERAALWNAKPENRHLPSLVEWARIRTLTEKQRWTAPQRLMMHRGGRFHGIRFTIAMITLALLGWAGFESYGTVRGLALLESLKTANIDGMPQISDELVRYRRWTNDELESLASEDNADPKSRLHASLALLPTDASQLSYLRERLLNAKPEEVGIIVSMLKESKSELIDDLWLVVEEPDKGEESQILRAASALAVYDTDNEARWKGVADRVVDVLVSENPLRLAVWINTLRPARHRLVKPLEVVYRSKSEDRPQTQIDLATDLLEQYAAEDVEVLANLLLDAEPKQFVTLFDEFAAHGDEALSKLNTELDRKLTFNWDDPPLDPNWSEPTAEVTGKITEAHGTINERFAFCQAMPLNEFQIFADKLRKSGYRPIRLRPYAHDGSVYAAAAWTRDGRNWRMATGQSAVAIQQQDEEQREEGFAAVDIAGYFGESDGMPAELYSALWMNKRDGIEDARIYAGARSTEHQTVYGALEKEGYTFRQSLQGFRVLDGQQQYSGVRTKANGNGTSSWNQSSAAFDAKEYFDKIHWDIDASNAPDTQTAKERNEKALSDAETKLKEKPDDVNSRYARGIASFNLGNDKQAVDDLNFVIDKAASVSSAYQYRAILHARMSKTDEAKKDLAKFIELSNSANTKVYLDVVVSAYLGEDAEAMKRLETFIEENEQDTGSLYNAACAYSICSEVFKEEDTAKSKVYADRAISLIKESVSKGYSNYSHMQEDADLDPIRETKGFTEIMKAGNQDLRYAAVWNSSIEFESLESHGISATEHLAKCNEMQTNGYRIVSISSASINGQLVTASVWHRPLISDDEKETQARRQANAAVAALRMGQAEKVWPLLKHSPDPRLRTWIIHRLSPLGASPDSIVKRLNEEPDVSIRRALILILGEYDDGPQIDHNALSASFLELFRDDPDPGIHGAAEWVLQRWGMGAEIAQIDKELATGKVEAERQWYVTQQGHTMVVIPGPVEFLMGSPATETDRNSVEYLHRKSIGRSFAIATKEVTVKQFQEFLRNTPSVRHNYTEKYAPEDNCPQTSVTWYEAAAYCRWLSEQEAIAEDQMCYPPIVEIKEGMKLPSDYLSRTGYRLPSETEWEYACRSRTVTSRYCGVADELLGQYAWFIKTSNDRTWPVGRLKPNDTGLFDMQGNVWEWCQERYESYSGSLGSVSEDREDNASLRDSTRRVLRGGSFVNRPSTVRSAYRLSLQPTYRGTNNGFRPSRTYPISP